MSELIWGYALQPENDHMYIQAILPSRGYFRSRELKPGLDICTLLYRSIATLLAGFSSSSVSRFMYTRKRFLSLAPFSIVPNIIDRNRAEDSRLQGYCGAGFQADSPRHRRW